MDSAPPTQRNLYHSPLDIGQEYEMHYLSHEKIQRIIEALCEILINNGYVKNADPYTVYVIVSNAVHQLISENCEIRDSLVFLADNPDAFNPNSNSLIDYEIELLLISLSDIINKQNKIGAECDNMDLSCGCCR
ncbi:MAG: hypothetical protein NZM04_09620 [Methylacidiphilales bacterium]|nr:hypothetical protein [Candidatus Methylacidiphilales bacterium]